MAQQYNLHQEANRLDMASMTDEIVLSNDAVGDAEQAARVQLDHLAAAQPRPARRARRATRASRSTPS